MESIRNYRSKRIEGRDRPVCLFCQREMTVARIEPADGEELWVYRCSQCGSETALLVEPLT